MKVEYVNHMGDDLMVVNAARVSFAKESKWELGDKLSFDEQGAYLANVLSRRDEKLIKYLATHKHWTPFGHPQITLRVKAPIFVARQLQKHVVGLVWNEVSRRYVDDEPEFYVPEVWRTKPEGSVKQGSGTDKLPKPEFITGFCANCGSPTEDIVRMQGGGRARKYCSNVCKYSFTNKNRNRYKSIFQTAQARAKREGKEWSIEFDTFDFPSHCPILGFELDYSYGKGKIQDNSPSFDRKDPSLEYVEGNVWIISNKANTMKSNSTKEERITFAKNILLRECGIVIDTSLSYSTVLEKAKKLYNTMIAEGYCAEQARMVLPQSMYTEWYWTGSLAAFARIYGLRSDTHAQKETQEVAKMIDTIIRPLFPVSWEALTD